MSKSEAARKRWQNMTEQQRRERVAKLTAGRKKAATPTARKRKLADAEAEIDRLGAEIDKLRDGGETVPFKLREQLRAAGSRRLSLTGE